MSGGKDGLVTQKSSTFPAGRVLNNPNPYPIPRLVHEHLVNDLRSIPLVLLHQYCIKVRHGYSVRNAEFLSMQLEGGQAWSNREYNGSRLSYERLIITWNRHRYNPSGHGHLPPGVMRKEENIQQESSKPRRNKLKFYRLKLIEKGHFKSCF